MAKNNLPHIPLYIGDWEKDCNVLSLESEGAWLRIIFKMFSKGKQSTIKIPTKSLQNLWRCSAESVQEIIDDLMFNDICDIDVEGNFTEFTCRRFVKENKLSKTRSEARKKGYEKNKTTTKPNQNKNKKLQNADNDNDNDIDINIDIDIPNKQLNNKTIKPKKGLIFPFESDKFKKAWGNWVAYKKGEYGFKYKTLQSEQGALMKLSELSKNENEAIKIIHESIANGWKGFFELKNENKNGKQQISRAERVNSAVDEMFGQ